CVRCACLRFRAFPTRRSSDLSSAARVQASQDRGDLTSDVFQPLHSLKGSGRSHCGVPARGYNAPRISTTSHGAEDAETTVPEVRDRKSTRLNSSHVKISYAVF